MRHIKNAFDYLWYFNVELRNTIVIFTFIGLLLLALPIYVSHHNSDRLEIMMYATGTAACWIGSATLTAIMFLIGFVQSLQAK